MSKKRILLLLIWLIILNLPYVFGYLNSSNELVFGGFLLNPIDGNSYLAKIQEGLAGNWFFQLPYSAETNSKAFLFIFYILLGQISRIFGLSSVFVFHFFRFWMGVLLFFTLEAFLKFLGFNKSFFKYGLLFTLLFGGGLGWLYAVSGNLPADFWVAEAFPFLASFTNPHFPLTIALILWALIFTNRSLTIVKSLVFYAFIGIGLANISPFSVVIVGVLLGGNLLLSWQNGRKEAFFQLLGFGVGTFPVILYQFILVHTDQVLAGWNVQNVTPAPNLGNFIFSFSPFLIGIVILLVKRLIDRKFSFSKSEWLMLIWVVSAFILLYLPLSLQRRFLVGYYVPIVALFFLLLEDAVPAIRGNPSAKTRLLAAGLMIFPLLSNLVILTGAFGAIASKSESLYISKDVINASQWIRENCRSNSVILSGLDTGLTLPSYTFSRTVYGHPFETVDYAETGKDVTTFWSGDNETLQMHFLATWGVDYLFYGAEEKALGSPLLLERFPVIYENSTVTIYEVKADE
jgi:hypothetical protein